MNPTELEDLRRLLDLLSSGRIKRFKQTETELELEFYAPAPPVVPVVQRDAVPLDQVALDEAVRLAALDADPDDCVCGHSWAAHTNGLCLQGCAEAECYPGDEAPEEVA